MSEIIGAVDRVIDGDTVMVKVRVRLRESAPELRTVGGEAAKDALRARWRQGTEVAILAGAVDEYGRMVGELREVARSRRGARR